MTTIPAAVTALKPNAQESKAKATDNAARLIMNTEVAAREAKTARLRAARLAMEADAPAPEAKPAKAAKPKKAK